MKDFYQKFQIFSHSPLWRVYISWCYAKALTDSLMFNIKPVAKRSNFTCLLCGVSGEITGEEFIKFVLKNNSSVNIIIIDLGIEQTESVKKLVNEKFPQAKIEIKQANALNLDFIKDKTIDWIDTDGFFGFFDSRQLLDLFKEWKRILKDDGFISFREIIPAGFLSSIVDLIRAFGAKIYMGVNFHRHSLLELIQDFKKTDFCFSRHFSPIPFFNRYCLTNYTPGRCNTLDT